MISRRFTPSKLRFLKSGEVCALKLEMYVPGGVGGFWKGKEVGMSDYHIKMSHNTCNLRSTCTPSQLQKSKAFQETIFRNFP